jgi:hypothetical protein
MSVTNNNKRMVDLPFMELLNQAPTATSALAAVTYPRTGGEYFYYMAPGPLFYRYDVVADTWQQLATPPTATATLASLRTTSRRGYHGRVLAASSTTITIPGLRGPALSGSSLIIERGPGAGQERTLTFVSESILDAGVITGTTTSTLADSTKKWRINQWSGYVVAVTFGTGGATAPTYKKVLYNDATTLYFQDNNLLPHDPWNNQVFVATAPYALPVTTAGSQAHYQIMASTFTVNTPWNVIPDYRSYFTTLTGGIYLLSSAALTPFMSLQYYDIANDLWQTKTVPQSLLLAALGTDASFENTLKLGTSPLVGPFSGSSISATTRSLSDTTLNLEPDRYANHRIYITSGSGTGQDRRITGHNSASFWVSPTFTQVPDSTSKYEIWPDNDIAYVPIGGNSSMLAYHPDYDVWSQGYRFDSGITTNVAVTMDGWQPIGVASSITPIASGITAINSTPTAAGTNYTIGDILTVTTGGTGAQVIVTSIGLGGTVTGLQLVNSGTATGYTVGTGRATTGGVGTGCTVEITSVGKTANITTSTATWFKTGDQITISGCSEAAWNTTYTILGVSTVTTTSCVFSVQTTANSAIAATASQGTTTLVDPTANWIPNEHVGRLVHIMVAGNAPTSQIRWITANTQTTLTFNTITAASNGTSKYIIYDAKAYGYDTVSRMTGRDAYGWATGSDQATNRLVDVTKSWIPGQWSGSLFKVEAGTGYGSGRLAIINNNSNTLFYATQSFTPDPSTKYEIADTWGLTGIAGTTTITSASGYSPNWVTNYFAGKRFRVTGGTTGLGQEAAITSNTANALTTATITAVSADATFSIISVPPRNAAANLLWAYNNTNPTIRGRYMYLFRGGGSSAFDIYDISRGTWIFGNFYDPQTETFTTGTSYTYDGNDTIYIAKGITASSPIRIFAYDINANTIRGVMTSTILQGTPTIGNVMEVIETPDGLKYLYVMQNTGTQFTRGLISF